MVPGLARPRGALSARDAFHCGSSRQRGRLFRMEPSVRAAFPSRIHKSETGMRSSHSDRRPPRLTDYQHHHQKATERSRGAGLGTAPGCDDDALFVHFFNDRGARGQAKPSYAPNSIRTEHPMTRGIAPRASRQNRSICPNTHLKRSSTFRYLGGRSKAFLFRMRQNPTSKKRFALRTQPLWCPTAPEGPSAHFVQTVPPLGPSQTLSDA